MTKSRMFLLIVTLLLLLTAFFIRLALHQAENEGAYKNARLVLSQATDAFWRAEHWL